MRILITNDDGIRAEGLRVLAEAAAQLGEVKVVAPDRERSACGHSMTMREVLRVKEVPYGDIAAYEVSGVPVDCVNVGLRVAWPKGCDLVLSGVNHGPNLGFDVTYSGTVAGAMEGAINGVPSIAVSMATFVEGQPLHLETASLWLAEHLGELAAMPMPSVGFLNVNIPAVAHDEIRGLRVVRMGRRIYEDRVEERYDPWGRPYYWQGGVATVDDREEETDVWAVVHGYVSLTPITMDWTDGPGLEALRSARPASSSD